MITLYQTPAKWNVPNISPFCIKLETYLRMAELPYETRPGDPRQAPTGKVPYIKLDGQLIGDSQQIIAALKRKFGDKVDAHLGPAERARGHALRRMLEEATYFTVICARWYDEAGWQAYKPVFKELLPPLVGGLIARLIRRQILKSAYAQGTSRHPAEVIYERGQADFAAIAAELGEKPFLFGDRPCSVDAVVYAFTASVLAFPADSPLKRYVRAEESLVRHTERMQQRFFPPERPPGHG